MKSTDQIFIQNSKWVVRLVLAVLCLAIGGSAWGQFGEAGVESPFAIGVGARALAMGNAGAAYPVDPTAFLWNPAGMAVVLQKQVGTSLTTFFEGTQYNYLGYIHPTMNTGTFGIGISRIGTGDILHTDEVRGVPVDLGTLDYWWGKVSLAYAATIWKGLSVGANLDVNRQVLGFYSTNGVGVDVGLHYGFQNESGLLNGLHLGFNWINALSPRLKLGVSTESVPYTFRGGIAKVFRFRHGTDRWVISADMTKPRYKGITYHVGTEYAFGNTVFVRGGMNNGEISFGGGLRLYNFQLDYASTRLADPEYFPRSHRFTLSFFFGNTIPEQRRLLQEARREEVQVRIRERVESDRRRRIEDGLRQGKDYLENGDFFNARLEFSRVLREDKENREAINLLEETTEKEQAVQKDRQDELLEQAREKDRLQRDNAFVNQRFTEGLESLSKGDFQQAIEKWREALQRDPDHPQINSYIEQAETELSNEVNRLIARANQLVRQENISEAYKVLHRAREQTQGNDELHQKVLREISTLDRYVDFTTNYQEGQQRYSRGEYDSAVRYLQKALESHPNHARARELYRNAMARAKGKKLKMTPEVRQLWERGGALYIDSRYEEAIQVWEEALKLDPDNVNLIEAIEGAKRRIELYKKKK